MGALELIENVEPLPQAPQRSVAAMPTPAHLLQLAVEQGADLDRLERLMALQERWEAGEARKAFVLAMTEFKAEPLEIFKRKSVSFNDVHYKHAELSDVADVIVPAMARHGLSHRWDVRQESARVIVTCTVTHKAGHAESVTMDAGPDDSGKKNKIQQIASAVTYLQRYTLLAIAGLATKSEDDDGSGAEGGGIDITNLVLELGATKTDETALAHWMANRDGLRGDQVAYDAFKDACVAHRKAIASGRVQP